MTGYVWRGDPAKKDRDVKPPTGAALAASAVKAVKYARFCELRDGGKTVAEAAAEVGVGPQAASRYERARLDAIGGEG